MVDEVRRIIIEGRERGVADVVATLQRLSGAYDGASVAADKTERATLSVQNALERERRALDDNYRARRQFEGSAETVARARAQGLIGQAEETRLLELAVVRHNQYGAAVAASGQQAQRAAGQTGLARHELINLSRQAQDVAVQLQAGQSPGVILLQQGSQIADVFASSRASVGSFFSQAAGWAGRFVVSAAGVTTATLAMGAAALYMGASYASAQRDVDRALAGQGAASGLDRGGINRIAAGASSPTGLSVSEAREAASAFAATGKLYEQNVTSATLITKQFAQAMGVDASEAAKRLAKDLSGDLVAAAVDWNKTLGFLDAKTLDHIRTLQQMGLRQEAIGALIEAAAPSIGKSAEAVGFWTRQYERLGNAISDTAEKWGAFAARAAQKTTGANLGAFSDEDRLTLLRQRRDSPEPERRSAISGALPGNSAASIADLNKEIAELEKKLQGAAKATADVRFNQLALEAQDFTRAIIPSIKQVEDLTTAINTMERAQAARLNRGLGADPQAENALIIARAALAVALEQEQVEVRKAQVFAQNAAAYQNVSATSAQTLAQMQGQLSVAQAVTGAAQIEAQHRATTNALLAQGKTLVDAIAVADAQRAIALAQVNTEADRTRKNLQDQGELIRAATEDEKARIKAAQEYNRLIEQGVDSQKAGAVAAQMRSASDAQAQAQAERDSAAAAQSRAQANANSAAQAEREAAAWEQIKINNAIILEQGKFIPFSHRNIQDKPFSFQTQTWDKNGGLTQFNPEGYKFTTETPLAMFAKGAYGPGGFSFGEGQAGPETDYIIPNVQGYGYQTDRYLSGLSGSREPGSVVGAVDQLLNRRNAFDVSGFGGPMFDQAAGQHFTRLLDLLPDDQKIGKLEAGLAKLNEQPETLARDELIKTLTDQLKQLKDATDKNTDALNAQLDPLFSQGHDYIDKLRIGFFENADGGIMTKHGKLALQQYADGGITTRPTLFSTSENYHPEAIIPLKNGAVPVRLNAPANSNQPPIVQNHYHYYGPGSVVMPAAGDQPRPLSPRQKRQGYGS